MIYKAIVGSRSYGLNVDGSDVDLAIVSDKQLDNATFRKDGYDLYLCTPDDLAVLRQGSCHTWWDWTRLFPHEFCIKNDLSSWIEENREEMVKALLPEIYEAYTTACADFIRHANGKNKRIMYAIHFRNMLANYAEGMTFAEALKPPGAYRGFLLSVRKGNAPAELVLEENAKARERAKAVAGFYAEPKASVSILEEFKHMVQKEVEKLNH